MKFSQIFQIFVPKDRKFFPLFVEAAENLVNTAAEFKELVKSSNDELNDRIVSVRAFEKKGDQLTHNIYEELNNTFITPFDRDDVHRLANSIDNVLDQINSASQKISRYQPKMPVDAFIAFADLIYQASMEIRNAMMEINNLRDPELIMQACVKLNELENSGDDVFDAFISKLFREEKDAVELIKQKEIIQALEKATDAAEDVADILKSIMVKTV
jgi:predicted phosphate transport protein (TIGR00153 family)